MQIRNTTAPAFAAQIRGREARQDAGEAPSIPASVAEGHPPQTAEEAGTALISGGLLCAGLRPAETGSGTSGLAAWRPTIPPARASSSNWTEVLAKMPDAATLAALPGQLAAAWPQGWQA